MNSRMKHHEPFEKIFARRFVNRTDRWFYQKLSSGRYQGYRCLSPGAAGYRELSNAVIREHLSGILTLALPAIDPDGRTLWSCWDFDHENGYLDRVVSVLAAWGLKSIREGKRPGRDGHLWLLFDEKVHADDLIEVNKEVLAQACLSLDCAEFFPKYANKMSQVRAPLGKHCKREARFSRGWFEGPERDVRAQLEWLSLQEPNNSSAIARLANAIRAKESTVRIKTVSANREARLVDVHTQRPILELIETRRWTGREWWAQCPLCAAEGHDRHKDNLRISTDGKFCCVFGGPGKVHHARDIFTALKAE